MATIVSSSEFRTRMGAMFALADKQLLDTIIFEAIANKFMVARNVEITASIEVNSNGANPLNIRQLDQAPPLKKYFIFNVKDSGWNALDTVKITLKAKYDTRPNGAEEYKTAFVVQTDKCSQSVSYEFRDKNVLSTTDLTQLTRADSGRTFFGLLTGKEYAGIGKALQAAKTDLVAYLTTASNVGTIHLLPSDSCKFDTAASDAAAFKAGSRYKAQMLQADGYAAMDSVSTAAAVYKLVRIKVGTGGNAKFYYGHLNAFKPSFGGVSFTLKYGRERDFNKE